MPPLPPLPFLLLLHLLPTTSFMITPPALALAAGKTPYELSMICTGDHDAGAVDTTMNKYLCCDLGPETCLDRGLGAVHSGGYVTISHMSAYNLIQQDSFGPLSGSSDAYVSVKIGGVSDEDTYKGPIVTATSGYVPNELNPTWPDTPANTLSLGYRRSGESGKVSLHDFDTGLELSHDAMTADYQFRIPYCSTLSYPTVATLQDSCTSSNGKTCESTDSSFAMPNRLVCNETAWVSLNPDIDPSRCPTESQTNPDVMCLKLQFTVTPFQLTVESQATQVTDDDPNSATEGVTTTIPSSTVGVAADVNTAAGSSFLSATCPGFGCDFGKLSSTADTLMFTGPGQYEHNDGVTLQEPFYDEQYDATELHGALVLRTPSAAKMLPADRVFARISINFPATVYVCRQTSSTGNLLTDVNAGSLKWLVDEKYEKTEFYVKDYDNGVATERKCWKKLHEATVKNANGHVISGAITLGGNYPLNQYNPAEGVTRIKPQRMYTVFLVPVDGPPPNLSPSSDFTASIDMFALVQTFIQFGLMFIVTLTVTNWHLDKNLSHRLDRIPTFLVTRTLTGTDQNLLSHLFTSYMLTENNVTFRANLYWSTLCVKLAMSIPFVILTAWGLATAGTQVNGTPAVGFAILFIGTAAILLQYGMKLWRLNAYRMSKTTLQCLTTTFACILFYAIATAFVDPAVFIGNNPVNFIAISVVFGTINVTPLLALTFVNDRTLRAAASQLLSVLTASSDKMPGSVNAVNWHGHGSAFNKLLGDVWSVADKHSPALPNAPPTSTPPPHLFDVGADVTKSSFAGTPAHRAKLNADLYSISLVTLLLYILVAWAFTPHAVLALLNAVTLISIDGIHASLGHGNSDWSPGYQSFLTCVARLSIMSCGSDLWLAGYSLTFLVYGSALSRAIVRGKLPTLTPPVASGVAFYGYPAFPKTKGDIAGSPGFCLAVMTSLFVALMAFSAYGALPLPMPDVEVGGLCADTGPWPSYVFGALSFFAVLIFCMAIATRDAGVLEARGLLAGELGRSYLWKKGVTLPIVLGLVTECLVVTAGLFVYGATRCSPIFTLSLFVPVIVAAGSFVAQIWKKNDYEIVVWPPAPPDFDVSVEEDEDVLVANMLGDLFGGEKSEGDDNMFKLPPMMKTGTEVREEVKMPPMPLKSALKFKQQQEMKAVKEKMANPQANVEDVKEGELMDFDDQSVVTLEAAMDGTDEDDDATVAKLAEVRNKFVHQRVNLCLMLYNVTQRHMLLRPLGFVGNKVGGVWRKTPCGRVKGGGKKKKKEEPTEADIADSIAAGDTGSADLSALMLGGAEDAKESVQFEEVNFSEMSLFSAFMGGYLITSEYHAVFGTMTMFGSIFLMGLIISLSSGLALIGHTIWVTLYIAIFTVASFAKYFSTFKSMKEDRTLRASVMAGAVTLLAYCAIAFVLSFKADPNHIGGLMLLNAFILYPTIVLLAFKFYKWMDEEWVINDVDADGDGKTSFKELLMFVGFVPVAFFFFFFLSLELYFWSDPFLATTVLLMLGGALVGLLFLRDWAKNDFWLSAKYQQRAGWLINGLQMVCIVLGFLVPTEARLFVLSLFWLFYMVECGGEVLAAWVTREPEEPIYFSPFLLPCYSFSAATNDIKDETENVIWYFKFLGAGCGWGVTIAMFVSPLSFGIFITCLFLLSIIVSIAFALGHAPLQLGSTAKYVSKQDIVDCAINARGKFFDRQKPVEIYDPDWQGKTYVKNDWDDAAEDGEDDKLKAIEAFKLGSMIESSERTMRYVEVKEGKKKVNLSGEDDDDGDGKKKKKKKSMGADEEPPRADGLFNWEDAIAEAYITCRGPLGFLGMFGAWYAIFNGINDVKYCYRSSTISRYDSKGGRKIVAKSEGSVDCKKLLKELPAFDTALDKRYGEEMRSVVHFMLMLINACDARLKHQKVNFTKFLRENRFKLMSNGITPPKDALGGGKGSFDVALVATWLTSLTVEERERFHMLRTTFNTELQAREREQDQLDEKRIIKAESLRERLGKKEESNCSKRFEKLKQMRNTRLEQWKTSLDEDEKSRFRELQVKWMTDPNVDVDAHNAKLREKFEQHVMVKTDEGTMEARNFLRDVESGEKYCRPGKFGRTFQFHDPDFPANQYSLGQSLGCRARIKDWKQSTQINHEAVIFDGGTDPDDVGVGLIASEWLLSAISMLAAAGGVGDGDLDDQIANLFVSHVGSDGQPKYNSNVGVYGVRLWKNNQWEVVTVDDFFPCLADDDEGKNDSNRGAVVGHSAGMKEIWVPLLEKAYAKYYGSYDVLEEGFVHHALKDLTGAECDCISLSQAARGSGKKSLWNSLLRFRRNGYILGAGSHGENAKFAFDTGIVPNACYSIYEVVALDGHKLMRLRNPPGEGLDEWKGDWGDKSTLWTKRLKSKLGWSDEEDNCFWMCFDDFCEIFRELYVCKWFDQAKWKDCSVNGEWEIGGKVEVEGIEVEKENTAVGLPNVHNHGCKVENNPQYMLEVDRPTEIRLKIEQVDSNGLASGVVHPIACYICKPHSEGRAARVQSLTKKNVVWSTGAPKKERCLEVYCTLQPGIYVVLAATYVSGMDGPFKISVCSTFEVELEQIWPPTWRADEPDSFAGKMALKLADKVGQAAAAGAEGLGKASAGMDKAGGMFGGDGDLELTQEEKDLEAQMAAKQGEAKEAAIKKAQDDAYAAAARGE